MKAARHCLQRTTDVWQIATLLPAGVLSLSSNGLPIGPEMRRLLLLFATVVGGEVGGFGHHGVVRKVVGSDDLARGLAAVDSHHPAHVLLRHLLRRDLVVRLRGRSLVVGVHDHLLATVVDCRLVTYYFIQGGGREDGGVGGVVGGLQGRVALLLLLVVAVEGLLADHGQLGLGRHGKWR